MSSSACRLLCALLLIFGCRERESDGSAPGMPSIATHDTVGVFQSDTLFGVSRASLHNGRLMIANQNERQALLIDLRTGALTQIGRKGSGPGEYGVVRDVFIHGDTVLVLDSQRNRAALFNVSGTPYFIRQVQLPPGSGYPDRATLRIGGKLALGWQSGIISRGTHPATFRDSVTFTISSDSTWQTWQRVTSVAGIEGMVGTNTNGVAWYGRPAFAATTDFELTAAGIVTADGRTGRLSLWSYDGVERLLLQLPDAQRRYIDKGELDAVLARADAKAARLSDGEEYRRNVRAMIAVLGDRPSRPFFDDMAAGSSLIVLRLSAAEGSVAREWLLVRGDGTASGILILPNNVTPLSAVGDTLVAVARDSLQVETLLFLRVRR